MKLSAVIFLTSCLTAFGFDDAPLKDGEGLRLEVLEFVLPAAKAAPIVDGLDGSDRSAATCYKKFTSAGLKPQKVYGGTLAAGKNEFEVDFADAGKDKKPLQLRLTFYRDELRKRVWAYGFVTPNYRIEDGRFSGELSLISSGVTPGAIKLLSVVPDSLDTKNQGRVRVLFMKLMASEVAVAAFPAQAADKVSIGVFATEVTLPFSDYERLEKMKLKGVELKKNVLGFKSAEVTGLFGGETLGGGRIRQRSAPDQESPAEPATTSSNLFDCDPESLAEWPRQGAGADGLGDPPVGAKGILINWFNWRRSLPKSEPVTTRWFRWNEDWKNPGVIVEEERAEGEINASSSLMCLLPDEQPYHAAVGIVGEEGDEDRRAVLLFVRWYERRL